MKVLGVLAITFTAVQAIDAGPLLRIDDLGTLGGSQMSGMAISPTGQVAGSGLDPFGNLRAFSSMSSPTDLTPAWASTASANGINVAGQVAGTTFADGNFQATLWSSGTAQVIGGLGGPDSFATAINGSGEIAGMATTPSGQGRAVIYQGDSVNDVSLPGSSWAAAYAVNGSGAIAGYAMDGNGAFQAYTWWPGGAYTVLGTLGGRNSYAFGMNDSGQVVGNSTTAPGYSRAFVWDSSGLRDLGTLGGLQSYAYGINNAGAAVGYSYVSGSDDTHAFVFMDGVLFDLNLLVEDLAGWELTKAYAINDAGQITGTGLLDGVERAFRLDPVTPAAASSAEALAAPEPATYATVLLGVLLGAGALIRSRY